MISVCMIVKNEEAMLAECLQSVAGADEIIVCDTGSTDRTVEIAERYGARICHYEWTDHFADARNAAIAHAACDYILVIDADERLDPGGIDALRAYHTDDAYYIKIHSCTGEWEHDAARYFRNDPEIRFVGRIHETLNIHPKVLVDVFITAYHSPAHEQDPNRNIRVLTKCLEDEPGNSRWHYYLAREYFYRQDMAKAEQLFLECINASEWSGEIEDALLYVARCRWHQHKGDKAREACLQALGMNPNFKEAAYFMAEMSWEHNKPPWLAMAKAGNNNGVVFRRYRS